MKSMYIGSGDTTFLLMGKNSTSHQNLLRRFVSDVVPYYNAKASPIDALRTGAILEERYMQILPDDYYPQYKVISKDMDVFKCSLDFAKLNNGNVVDFDEMKTCNFDDFLLFEQFRDDEKDEAIEFIKKKYKHYYNQVQEQLYCTDLYSANIVFVVVYSYEDFINEARDIQPNEYIRFRINRDENVINKIKQCGLPFQYLKDFYTKDEKI
ncbi:MAG: hypothetical protein RR137_10890 [Odoribacter sp.]